MVYKKVKLKKKKWKRFNLFKPMKRRITKVLRKRFMISLLFAEEFKNLFPQIEYDLS